MKRAAIAVVLAVTGCAGSSSSSEDSGPDPDVAIVVDRYGDCLQAIGDSLDGEVLPQSTDQHTYVGFHGKHAVVFRVIRSGGKVYTVPDDPESQRRVSKGGKTC